jgi:hypothetical protein
MPNVTFEYNGATITVRERIGRDVLDENQLGYEIAQGIIKARNLPTMDAIDGWDWLRIPKFANVLMRSTIVGSLGYDWPDYERSTQEAKYAAYEAWLNSPPGLMGKWLDSLETANLEKLDPNE